MWCSSSYTDTGQIRSVNEDAILDLSAQQLWLVADGMGGHADGSYASQLVASLFANYQYSALPSVCKRRVIQALDVCNSQLIEKAEREHSGVIGSTVALLQARSNSVLCTWSGDSRIYRLRNGQLKQLTRDHSQQSAMEDRDQVLYPAALLAPSQMLTKAIGGDSALAVDHCWYQRKSGDSFLLCTDGLNKEVSDEEICSAMTYSSNGEQVMGMLVELYQRRGARDNVGMVLVSDTPEHDVDEDGTGKHASTFYL